MLTRNFDVVDAGLQVLDSLLHLRDDLVKVGRGVDLLRDLPPGRVVLVCSDSEEDFDVGPKRRLFLFVLVRF